MAEKKKRLGRPTKPGTAGQRNSLGLRVTAETKRKLEAAALKSGRSQSQEAEFRIVQSFLEEEAYGGQELHGLLRLLVGAADIIQARTGKSWSNDWDTSVTVQAAWTKLMEAVAAKPPPDFVRRLEDAIPYVTERGSKLSDPNDPVEKEALIDELRKWRNRLTRNEGLGRDVADELFPDRATVR